MSEKKEVDAKPIITKEDAENATFTVNVSAFNASMRAINRPDLMIQEEPTDEPTYPPVSGGAPEMDADDTACGALCQDLNDRMWAKLGPVDDVELPF